MDTPRILAIADVHLAAPGGDVEQLLVHRAPLVWAQGWTFFDRRLTTLDPGGNRVELVALHAM